MTTYNTIPPFLFACTVCFLAVSTVATATTLVVEENGIHVTVYAPGWIWQGQNVNVLVVLENTGNATAELELALRLPEGLEDHFEFSGPVAQSVTLNPKERKRIAFANIASRSGFPRQTYPFEILVSSGNQDLRSGFIIPYSIKTVRGAAVSEGLWAALLPAILAALWCLVLGGYLLRRAKPGAWKTPSDTVWSASVDGAD